MTASTLTKAFFQDTTQEVQVPTYRMNGRIEVKGND